VGSPYLISAVLKSIYNSISIQELLNKANRYIEKNCMLMAIAILDACVVKSFSCVEKIDELDIPEGVVKFSPRHVAQILMALHNNKCISMVNYYEVVCPEVDRPMVMMKNSRFL
jgi:hypothetical protein